VIVILAVSFGVGAAALAADAPAKPDCAAKQNPVDDAKATAKTADTADLAGCKEKKGKD
jgi:hypothetical protein